MFVILDSNNIVIDYGEQIIYNQDGYISLLDKKQFYNPDLIKYIKVNKLPENFKLSDESIWIFEDNIFMEIIPNQEIEIVKEEKKPEDEIKDEPIEYELDENFYVENVGTFKGI